MTIDWHHKYVFGIDPSSVVRTLILINDRNKRDQREKDSSWYK